MRYPEGKEAVTGYMHESWHFRYVGIEIATDIFKRAITLEEYLGNLKEMTKGTHRICGMSLFNYPTFG